MANNQQPPLLLLPLLLVALVPAPARSSAADWPCEWTSFPRATPSANWPDGPIVGNGNMGFAVGGAPGSMALYGTVHGFWSASLGSNSTMPPLGGRDGGRAGSGFPMCPGANCTITVGLTLLRLLVSSPQLTGAWTASLDLARAAATVVLGGGGGASLEATLWASATTQVAILTLRNNGSAPLAALNVTLATNDNVQRVPTQAACFDGGAGTGAPEPCPAGAALADALVTKDANSAAARSAFPITAAAALRVLAASAGAAAAAPPQAFSAVEPQGSWVGTVDTLTRGITQLIDLPPGASVTLAISMAASRDPGVFPSQTPAQAVAARLAAVGPGDVDPLRTAHEAWWAGFWSRSAVSLGGEPATEAFWYSSMYALGSGTRAGQVVMDLWSPWRTTDYSAWRSNPTMDYNQQALYSPLVASNHLDLLQPFYDMLAAAVASGSPAAESAALGCPGGLHLSVDLAPFGLKLGVFGEPQAWGIRSNGAYAAVLHAYHWAAADHADAAVLQWAESQLPFLMGVASFWTCFLTKVPVPGAPDGYRFHSIGDCDGDEGCDSRMSPAERTNPVWTLAYVRRLLEMLLSMAAALGRAADPAWADVLAHLPPTATTVVGGVVVLSAYGEGAANASASQASSFKGQAGYLHSLWPGETLSPLSEPNATLAAAALATFNFTQWSQDNSFSWSYSAAARAGVPPDHFLPIWRKELTSNLKTNRLVAFGGLCSDSLGAAALVHDLLVQSQEGFLRLFPAWPGNQSASFASLRMRGALLVSAAYAGRAEWAGQVAGRTGGTLNATMFAEAGGDVALLSPWPAAPRSALSVVDASAGGAAVNVSWTVVPGAGGGDVAHFAAQKGHAYVATLV